ncbi:hypothetical protein E3J62_09160 [candidate division TA06 bacterium]|uniref:Uncharacterized protein n=1 Tax=candidate division TA06 bacterium TaxID=2250710 RepID=A0A523UQS4_UNCT6|nr:MAG: hypothetical protein E3J62_09160 [candidate division TA06 bacterium]
MEEGFHPLQFLLVLFLAHNLRVLAALWVYDDARKRFLRPIWAALWAVATYPAVVIVFFFYRILRPPVLFEDAPALSIGKKLAIYFASYPLGFLMAVLIIFMAITST